MCPLAAQPRSARATQTRSWWWATCGVTAVVAPPLDTHQPVAARASTVFAPARRSVCSSHEMHRIARPPSAHTPRQPRLTADGSCCRSRQKTFFQPEQPWELALTSGQPRPHSLRADQRRSAAHDARSESQRDARAPSQRPPQTLALCLWQGGWRVLPPRLAAARLTRLGAVTMRISRRT
eukprot:7384999-Prymnesium_polylepis.3